jgi:hypothetical protein
MLQRSLSCNIKKTFNFYPRLVVMRVNPSLNPSFPLIELQTGIMCTRIRCYLFAAAHTHTSTHTHAQSGSLEDVLDHPPVHAGRSNIQSVHLATREAPLECRQIVFSHGHRLRTRDGDAPFTYAPVDRNLQQKACNQILSSSPTFVTETTTSQCG